MSTAAHAAIADREQRERLAPDVLALYRPAEPRDVADLRRQWRCSCGQLYRTSGSGRHRIYWPEGAPASEPVMDGSCLCCGEVLPGKQRHGAWGRALDQLLGRIEPSSAVGRRAVDAPARTSYPSLCQGAAGAGGRLRSTSGASE